MNVIYDIITEEMVAQFHEDLFGAMYKLINDVIAIQIQNYLSNPQANPEVREQVQKYWGDISASYIFHKELDKRGVFDLLREIIPETILMNTPEYLQSAKEKLMFIRQNYKLVRTVLPARNRSDWLDFLEMFSELPYISQDQIEHLKSNKSLFFQPHEKDRRLKSAYIISADAKWNMSLNAILYNEYCASAGVKDGIQDRSAFM